MSFFDSKEEVISIELTQKGKHLLSKGIFKPKYYAFFDDDILYDSQYALFDEKQNESQPRLLDETPYIKPIANFSSVENRLNELNEVVLKDNIKVVNEIGVSSNNLPYSIGTSDHNSEYLPAWNISMLTGDIASSLQNIDSSANNTGSSYVFLKIPQINLVDGEAILSVSDREGRSDDDQSKIFIEMADEADFDILLDEKNLLNIIQVIERNTQDNNKNFNIEFFVEDGDKWKQLQFFKDVTNIKNDILLDDYINSEVASQIPDENCVEYYFEVLLDNDVAVPNADKQSGNYQSPISNVFKPFGEDC